MQVIGAGLPRTATSTQLLALEQLGFADCYHMRNVFADLDGELTKWERVVAGEDDWDSILGDFESCCDFPTARFYRELAEFYPEAKVVLTVRDAEGWVRSMRETIWPVYYGDSLMRHVNAARALVNPDLAAVHRPDAADPVRAAGRRDRRRRHRRRRRVRGDHGALERAGEGHDPAAAAARLGARRRLGAAVRVPRGAGAGRPVPHINDTAAFREGIVGGAMADLGDWWDQRERPASGLHGVAAR